MDKTSLFISEVQRFSIHDGPGLRTTVFLKGCNLKCAWCHNPETQKSSPQIQYHFHKCQHCRTCVNSCPNGAMGIGSDRIIWNADACRYCGQCTSVCVSDALHPVGELLTAEQLFEILQKDRDVFPDFSGVTFSGGEPLLQTGALTHILPILKSAGYHIAIDTAGNVPLTTFDSIVDYADLFLFDIKSMDDSLHRKYTGVGNNLILANLRRLCERRKKVWIRIPLIYGINDTVENISALKAFLQTLPVIERIDLLPYHAYGIAKAESLQIYQEHFEPPLPERIDEIKNELRSCAIQIY